jgi:SAM-dependent methyltransferase
MQSFRRPNGGLNWKKVLLVVAGLSFVVLVLRRPPSESKKEEQEKPRCNRNSVDQHRQRWEKRVDELYPGSKFEEMWKGKDPPLSALNHWIGIQVERFQLLVYKASLPLQIREGDLVFESGCGAGAFLQALKKFYNCRLSGSDFSTKQIGFAKKYLQGDFYVADSKDLNQTPDDSVDHAVSFGVFYYFANLDHAEQALSEMLRITKPGGNVYIGNVDTPPEGQLSFEHCVGEGGFAIAKSWWSMMAKKHNFLLLNLIDENNTIASEWGMSWNRYSVYIRKPGPKDFRWTGCYGSWREACDWEGIKDYYPDQLGLVPPE